jgi:polysaccharide export outer membrane protein
MMIMSYIKSRVVGISFLAVIFVVGVVSAAWGQNFSTVTEDQPVPQEQTGEEVKKGEEATDEEIMAMVPATGLPPNVESSRYTLGADDVVRVTVMRHPEVSGDFLINKEGKIQYAFVGDVEIVGLTKDEAAERLKGRLAEYIVNPEVSVIITGYNSKVVYVVGEVGSPGKIYMRGDTITVLEALVGAQLPQLTGVTKKSRLITPSDSGKAVRRDVNVYALLYEGDLRENLVMKPGDVLYIPATFLTKTMRAIQPVTAPISNASGPARRVMTGF